jgi:hypothetical protein
MWYAGVSVAGRVSSALSSQFSGLDSKRRPKFVSDDKPLHYDSFTNTVLGPMKLGRRFSHMRVLVLATSHLRPLIPEENLIMRG